MNRCKATSVITLIPEPSSFIPHPSLLDPKFFAVPDDQTTNRCSKWLISDCSKKLCWWVHKGQRLIPTLKCQKVCKTHNTCSYCYCLVTNSQTGCLNILPPSPPNIFIFFVSVWPDILVWPTRLSRSAIFVRHVYLTVL